MSDSIHPTATKTRDSRTTEMPDLRNPNNTILCCNCDFDAHRDPHRLSRNQSHYYAIIYRNYVHLTDNNLQTIPIVDSEKRVKRVVLKTRLSQNPKNTR